VDFVTGTQILALVGVENPTQIETLWADAVASAVNSGITVRLNGAVIASPSPANDELLVAAGLAGAEAFKRREAIFGQTGYADLEANAVRLSRDYLDGVQPLIDRYSNGPGIG
jgi:hypothetical protein